jgi:hypothetical protein
VFLRVLKLRWLFTITARYGYGRLSFFVSTKQDGTQTAETRAALPPNRRASPSVSTVSFAGIPLRVE